MSGNPQAGLLRRSFLSRLGAGISAVGATLAAGTSTAGAQSAGSLSWQPSRHAQDNWLDMVPGQHRFVFDTTTPDGLRSVMMYVNNYFVASQDAYGLKDSDLAVVIVVRHLATPFAYNDAMWSKYGAALSQLINFTDRKTKQPPSTNVYKAGGDVSLDNLSKRGVQLAICAMATRLFAGGIAKSSGGNGEAVYNELISNLIGNAQLVPAGIVTVNRAQERGYSLAHGG